MINLTTKQNHATYFLKDNETTEILFGGGAGGGKSFFGCLWLIEGCTKYPGTRWVMGRSKLKTLKETTLNSFFDACNILGINHQVKFNSQSGVIHFSNGSEIILKDLFSYPSDPNFDSLGSLEITGAFVDECNQIAEKAWLVLKSRIRYRLDEYGLIPKMLGTCNPSKNWVYHRFYKPSRNNTLKPSIKFIQSLLSDNPHISKHYKENLQTLDKNSRERLLNGNWDYDDDPTALCQFDDIRAVFLNDHLQEEGNYYLTADIARLGSDKAVILVWDGWVVVDYKIYDISLTTEIQDCINLFRQKYGIAKHKCVADQDGLGAGVVDNCGIKGFVNGAKPFNEDTGEDYKAPKYNNLQTQCSYLLAKKINSNAIWFKASIETKYQEEIEEELGQLKNWKVDDENKVYLLPKSEIKNNIGRSPDFRDALLMRSYFDYSDNNEYFINY